MEITIVFILGLIIAFIGVIPPGMLNMSAAKISLKEGHNRGIMFSLGVCAIVCVQTFIAAILARYLSNHPDVIEILQRVALVLFILITIYFLVLAQKQPKTEIPTPAKSKHSRFFQGMLLSGLNLFPIPYQSYMTLTIASFGWMSFDKVSIGSYVAGSASGTFIMLYIYIFFFDKIKGKAFTTQKNMNYIIGSITGLVAVFTLINIISEM
ncbi:MAG: LysE family transporter [Flavobacteriaceae bacterium]|nr:LysE family transporter [Bacteroidia bacterium]MBT8289047.1 LysE family transporter [Bacteroidia bacterium]NNF74001.1 LysE family transporter [Flavobacteriaceae bacterium]NNK72867.1 LysE family transporter [Flavobacteriaceae bacterium]